MRVDDALTVSGSLLSHPEDGRDIHRRPSGHQESCQGWEQEELEELERDDSVVPVL